MSNTEEVGYVTSVRDFLVHIDGLPTVRINDIVESEKGIRGVVSALFEDSVEVLIMDEGVVIPGELFKRSKNRLQIRVGTYLLGRAINPLGVPIDGRGVPSNTSSDDQMLELDNQATGIDSRRFITEQFVTGLTLIDTLIPLGKGQRELILGDAHSGKTTFLIDLIVNQKNNDIVCIYASIGKPSIAMRNLIDILNSNQAFDRTVIIGASSSDPAPLIFLAPQTAFTVAEYFQRKGKDVLLILDDLGNHAKIYREISLIGNKAPGRESYPGDIFYQHSHLVERAGCFKKEFGGGSITALPVIELNLNDFTTFIPTNLMSMTDGHLMFKANLHSQGQTPAIDISLSVSRVGRQTQNQVQNLLSQRVRQLLAEAGDLETVSRFSTELSFDTQLKLHQKSLIEEIIRQESLTFIPNEIQSILLALVFTTFLQNKDASFMKQYKNTLIQGFYSDPTLSQITTSFSKLSSDNDLIMLLEKSIPLLNKLCNIKADNKAHLPLEVKPQ
jgi:F-type H+-transporting ATPase subunit alpha